MQIGVAITVPITTVRHSDRSACELLLDALFERHHVLGAGGDDCVRRGGTAAPSTGSTSSLTALP